MTTTVEAVRTAVDANPHLGPRVTTIKVSSRRKTLGMTARGGDSGITLHVPADCPPDVVVTALAASSHKIGRLLLQAKEHAPEHPVKEFVNGEGFLWLGKNNRLRLVDNPTAAVRHVDDHGKESEHGTWRGRWLELDRAARHRGPKPIIDWYIREGTAWLQQQTAPLWTRMTGNRRPMPAVYADNIGRTRWGAHAGHPDPADDTVRIAWQTFQLPPTLVRHVLTHELVHATRPGGKAHGREFWRAFERAEIGARRTKRDLDEQGRTVWMGDVHRPA
jgi:predicted metal-dependent hydrolase